MTEKKPRGTDIFIKTGEMLKNGRRTANFAGKQEFKKKKIRMFLKTIDTGAYGMRICSELEAPTGSHLVRSRPTFHSFPNSFVAADFRHFAPAKIAPASFRS